ncbi:thermonuclease family protein [Rhizobium sp. CG4]|nr:thermonuclease family protein [Rhizobium sp. CG4]
MGLQHRGNSLSWSFTNLRSKAVPVTVMTALAVISLIVNNAAAHTTKVKPSQLIRNCETGNRATCVVDGDTIRLEGQKIRIADIDTPEVRGPKCASELSLGIKATGRLMELINDGPFELQAWPGRDKDRYGRNLRVLVRDGRSLGDILFSEGLARTWSGTREPWC